MVPPASGLARAGLRPARSLAALLTLGPPLVLAACHRHDPVAEHRAAEAQVIAKQISGLRGLVSAAEHGTLLRKDQLVIGVLENVLRELISAALPQERIVDGRFRVKVETASVSFRGSQGLVTLRGRVSPLGAPASFALLQLEGGLDEIEIASGRLTGRIVLHHLEVERAAAAGAESDAVRSLIEELGHERLDALAAVVPKIEIPVHLEDKLEVAVVGDGPLMAAPGELPLKLSVARLIPLNGRLWIVLDIAAGPWRREARKPAR